jgi:hypothetical protein
MEEERKAQNLLLCSDVQSYIDAFNVILRRGKRNKEGKVSLSL